MSNFRDFCGSISAFLRSPEPFSGSFFGQKCNKNFLLHGNCSVPVGKVYGALCGVLPPSCESYVVGGGYLSTPLDQDLSTEFLRRCSVGHF